MLVTTMLPLRTAARPILRASAALKQVPGNQLRIANQGFIQARFESTDVSISALNKLKSSPKAQETFARLANHAKEKNYGKLGLFKTLQMLFDSELKTGIIDLQKGLIADGIQITEPELAELVKHLGIGLPGK